MNLINQEKTLETAAAKAGMSEKTARKYRRSGKLPSQCKVLHTWRTRQDPFDQDDWHWVEDFLKTNRALEAKTLFEALQREKPGNYQDGQLRTFQRRVRLWQALHGPGQEVYFPQIYEPGHWCESDFTRMKDLVITINGQPFDHMLYHFVLCWSNKFLHMCKLTFDGMTQRQLEVTELISQSAGAEKLCPDKIIDSVASELKKTRLFWV